jgi:hypothetical protein
MIDQVNQTSSGNLASETGDGGDIYSRFSQPDLSTNDYTPTYRLRVHQLHVLRIASTITTTVTAVHVIQKMRWFARPRCFRWCWYRTSSGSSLCSTIVYKGPSFVSKLEKLDGKTVRHVGRLRCEELHMHR